MRDPEGWGQPGPSAALQCVAPLSPGSAQVLLVGRDGTLSVPSPSTLPISEVHPWEMVPVTAWELSQLLGTRPTLLPPFSAPCLGFALERSTGWPLPRPLLPTVSSERPMQSRKAQAASLEPRIPVRPLAIPAPPTGTVVSVTQLVCTSPRRLGGWKSRPLLG